MQRFFTILVSWLVLILVLNGLFRFSLEEDGVSGNAQPNNIADDIDTGHPLYAVLKQAHDLVQDKAFLNALKLLESRTHEFDQLPETQRRMSYEYYRLRGLCHAALWQYVDAEDMWRKAGDYATRASDQKRIHDLIQMSKRAIEDMNQERDLKEDYQASPNIGPAAQLRGKIALIYVFLADGTFTEWGLRQRTEALATWQLAQEWLVTKARQYGSDVTFSQRVFVLNKHPLIKRLRVGDQYSGFENSDQVAMLAAKHFGFDSIEQFIEQIKLEEGADQVVLMYHLARDGRSFASRCMQACNEFGEFVFLMESPDVKAWQSLRYTQAHESLHLFGADDLYNIRQAKYFAVHDIMNYPSSVLEASTMEDITAYAIGISDHKPRTPFIIRNYTARRQ